MGLDVHFHNAIQSFNFLERPTQWCDEKARENKFLYKGVLVVNHLFRAVSMWAFLKYYKSGMKTKLGMCFAGSLMYRLTVESNCAYKFAIPAFFGGWAFLTGSESMRSLVNGKAFRSFSAFREATSNSVPFAGYLTYITLTTSYDVDHPKKKCH